MLERKSDEVVTIHIKGFGYLFSKAVFTVKGSANHQLPPLLIETGIEQSDMVVDQTIPKDVGQLMVKIFGKSFDPTIFIRVPKVGEKPEIAKIFLSGPEKQS